MSTSNSARREAACCEIEQSSTVEAYLKAVFVLTADSTAATTSGIANRLQVTSASASTMMTRLRHGGLVHAVGWGRFILTDHGAAHARAIVRRHRLLETFLHRSLGLSWDEVHTEAEALEHGLSEQVEDLMAAALGHPARDPHGDPIPAKLGPHDERPGTPLRAAHPGTTFRVDRVRDVDSRVLRRLADAGIVPGVAVDVLHSDPRRGVLVTVSDRHEVLDPSVVGLIWGEPVVSGGRDDAR